MCRFTWSSPQPEELGVPYRSNLRMSKLRPTLRLCNIPQLVCGNQNTQFDLQAPWGPAKQRQKEMSPRGRDWHGQSPEMEKRTCEQNTVLGEDEAGDDRTLRQEMTGRSGRAGAGLASAPGFRGPRRGWRRGSIPCLWRDLYVPETRGYPGKGGCSRTGNAAWTSPPGHRLVSRRVT